MSNTKMGADNMQGGFWKSFEDEDSIMPLLKLSYQKFPP